LIKINYNKKIFNYNNIKKLFDKYFKLYLNIKYEFILFIQKVIQILNIIKL